MSTTSARPIRPREPARGPLGRYREHNITHHDTLIVVVPGAADLLADLLGSGLPVGVVSSKRADMVRQGMRVTELPSVDVQAVRAAGMAAVAITWGAGEEEALRALGPDAVVRDILELRSVLAGLLPFD